MDSGTDCRLSSMASRSASGIISWWNRQTAAKIPGPSKAAATLRYRKSRTADATA